MGKIRWGCLGGRGGSSFDGNKARESKEGGRGGGNSANPHRGIRGVTLWINAPDRGKLKKRARSRCTVNWARKKNRVGGEGVKTKKKSVRKKFEDDNWWGGGRLRRKETESRSGLEGKVSRGWGRTKNVSCRVED